MFLNAAIGDEIRGLANSNDWQSVAKLSCQSLTVGGALQLACLEQEAIDSFPANSQEIQTTIEDWSHEFPILAACRNALKHRGVWKIDDGFAFVEPKWEVFPAPLENQLGSREWSQFLIRFSRSLKANGFGKMSQGLSNALEEMTSNITEHATPQNSSAWTSGAVAFEVTTQHLSFSVADVGQGILSSLAENPDYGNLRSGEAALYAAVVSRATAKVDRLYGDGFLSLNNALLDLNGQLRFRSDDGQLRASGLTDQRHWERVSNQIPIQGFQINVHCSLDGAPDAPELAEFLIFSLSPALLHE